MLIAAVTALAQVATTQRPVTKDVSVAIVQDYRTGHDLEDVQHDFELMQELGVSTWRGSVRWADHESERGRYDFAWLHDFADLAARHGIALRPYVGYTPEWAASGGRDDQAWNDPPRDLGRWEAFVRRLVSAMRRHANVRSFELYEEPDSPRAWEGSRTDHAALLARGRAGARSANRRVEILPGGLARPDPAWIETSCRNIRASAVAFHALPERATGVPVEIEGYLDAGYHDGFLPTVQRRCAGRAVWVNAAGFATGGGRSERDQANWWARTLATLVADSAIQQVGIANLRDAAPDQRGDGSEANLGLTRADRTRKLAFHTVKLLTVLLATKRITVADDELAIRVTAGTAVALHHHLFVRPDRRQVLIVWDLRGSPALDVTLTRPGARVTEYTLDGRPVPFAQFDGRVLRRLRLARGHVRIFDIAPPGGERP
ncbi:MAG TPA: beta-galactosidase [Gemmatimonadales bacterium]|nr:beta-galactosidase [Gemmatimonadales bacterium]